MNKLQKLKNSDQARRTITLQRGDESVVLELRLLRERDYAAVTIKRDDLARTQGINSPAGSNALFSLLVVTAALYDPDTNQPVFENHDQAAETLLPSDIQSVLSQYNDLETDYAPYAAQMDEAEFGAFLDTLKKTPSVTTMSGLNSHTLKKLMLYLVCPPAI